MFGQTKSTSPDITELWGFKIVYTQINAEMNTQRQSTTLSYNTIISSVFLKLRSNLIVFRIYQKLTELISALR